MFLESKDDLGKLRWRCRRGMLELDATLLAFLERAYPGADPALQATFEALLEMDDSDILDLMTGNSTPVSPLQARLLALLTQPLPAGSG